MTFSIEELQQIANARGEFLVPIIVRPDTKSERQSGLMAPRQICLLDDVAECLNTDDWESFENGDLVAFNGMGELVPKDGDIDWADFGILYFKDRSTKDFDNPKPEMTFDQAIEWLALYGDISKTSAKLLKPESQPTKLRLCQAMEYAIASGRSRPEAQQVAKVLVKSGFTKSPLSFEILCDNKNSYPIVLQRKFKNIHKCGKPVVLIRCDRMNIRDNERGLKLANKIRDFLSSLPDNELESLLNANMFPKE